jgi:succinate dehydrogenase (ubiquinone) membrane anchor subunit
LYKRATFSSSTNKTEVNQNIENPNLTLAGETPNPMHGSNHWNFERAVSVASLGLIGAAAVYPHAMIDFGLGFIIPLHCHIGFGAIITDYLPQRKFPVIYRFSRGLLYASTALTIYGLYKYNTEDVGIIEGTKNIWNSKKLKKSEEEQ